MKDKMDIKKIMNIFWKIFLKENKYLKKIIVFYVELYNIKVKICCGLIFFKYIFNILFFNFVKKDKNIIKYFIFILN